MKAHPGESITWVGFFCEKAEQHRVRTGWLCALACQRSHEDDLIRSALDDRGGCSRCQHHTPGRGAFVIDRLEDCLSRPDTWTDSNHVPWFGDHRRQRGDLDVVGLDAAGAPGSGSARRPERTQVDDAGEVFQIHLTDGRSYSASTLAPEGSPRVSELASDPRAARLAARIAGRQVELLMRSSDGRLRVVWRTIVHDDSHYFREEIDVGAARGRRHTRDCLAGRESSRGDRGREC